MRIHIPSSLRVEHAELHDFAAAASREPEPLGDCMRRVARLLEQHSRKEEAFALPPLGLLERLARGEFHPEMAEVLTHTEWLKNNLPLLFSEHQALLSALEEVLAAASAAKRLDLVDFAERLINHARIEEQVLYPAAILVGELVRLRLGERACTV